MLFTVPIHCKIEEKPLLTRYPFKSEISGLVFPLNGVPLNGMEAEAEGLRQ